MLIISNQGDILIPGKKRKRKKKKITLKPKLNSLGIPLAFISKR